jgi:hypothetical protein
MESNSAPQMTQLRRLGVVSVAMKASDIDQF